MTLPASGTITLLQILAEFGAPAGTGLTSLYRGGAYVPSTSGTTGVPSSGAISLQSFYGASGSSALSASLSPSSVNRSRTRPSTITQSVTASPSGGTSPYTYAWSWQSGGAGITLSNATSMTCDLSSTTSGGAADITRTGVLQCIITDAAAASVTRTCNVEMYWAGSA